MPEKIIQVTTMTSQRETAEAIAQAVLELRLAACVQIDGPVESHYHWKGNLETAQEWRCVMKTRESLWPRLESVIRSLHPYEIPEILALPVSGGFGPYLNWLEVETGGEGAF
jgi:periplasmic divalent cation tolerance protein